MLCATFNCFEIVRSPGHYYLPEVVHSLCVQELHADTLYNPHHIPKPIKNFSLIVRQSYGILHKQELYSHSTLYNQNPSTKRFIHKYNHDLEHTWIPPKIARISPYEIGTSVDWARTQCSTWVSMSLIYSTSEYNLNALCNDRTCSCTAQTRASEI